ARSGPGGKPAETGSDGEAGGAPGGGVADAALPDLHEPAAHFGQTASPGAAGSGPHRAEQPLSAPRIGQTVSPFQGQNAGQPSGDGPGAVPLPVGGRRPRGARGVQGPARTGGKAGGDLCRPAHSDQGGPPAARVLAQGDPPVPRRGAS